MKKILLTIIALLTPSFAFAGLQTVPWLYSTTTSSIYPYPSSTLSVGIGTTSPYANHSVVGANGVVADHYAATSTLNANTFNSFLNVGTAPFLGQSLISAATSTNNWAQIEIHNSNSGNNASSIFAVGNDLGTNNAYFGEFGMNSSLYNNASFTGQGGNDVFVGASDSRLIFGSASSTASDASSSIVFFTHGWLTANEKMRLYGNGNFGIGSTTPGSLLSVGNTSGINLVPTGTSTFVTAGIDLRGGCFSINGTCIGGSSGSGVVSNGAAGSLAWYSSSGTTLVGTSTGTITITNLIATSTSATSSFMGTVVARSGGSFGVGTTTNGNNAVAGFIGPLYVGGGSTSASSTFEGNVDVNKICIRGTTNCLGASGGISSAYASQYASTSYPSANQYSTYWTYPSSLASGKYMEGIVSCSRQGTAGLTYFILVNSSQGTTTAMKFNGPSATNAGVPPIPFTYPFGGAVATTTESNIHIALSSDGSTILTADACLTSLFVNAHVPN